MKLLLTAAALSMFVSMPSSALSRQDNQPPQDNEKDKRDQPPPPRPDDRKQDDRKQQDDKRQQEDRKQQDEKRQQDEKNKDRDRPQQDRNQQDRDRSQQQDRDRTQQQDRDRTQQQDRDRAPQTERDRSSREDRDQRAGEPPRQDPNRVRQENRDQQSARNSGTRGRGQRIPDDRFRSSFGRQHTFHVQGQSGGSGQRDGDRRFQYGGYYFEYVDAWPNDWSYDDDLYIESIGDDYYLYDMRHPEMRILVIVVE